MSQAQLERGEFLRHHLAIMDKTLCVSGKQGHSLCEQNGILTLGASGARRPACSFLTTLCDHALTSPQPDPQYPALILFVALVNIYISVGIVLFRLFHGRQQKLRD